MEGLENSLEVKRQLLPPRPLSRGTLHTSSPKVGRVPSERLRRVGMGSRGQELHPMPTAVNYLQCYGGLVDSFAGLKTISH